MKKKLIAFFVLLVLTPSLWAGVVDLELDLDFPDTSQLVYGQIIPFSLTVNNNGPDDAGSSSTVFLPNTVFIEGNIFEGINGNPEILIAQDLSMEQECLFFILSGTPPPPPFPPPSVGYIVDMPIIPANSSITCYGLARVFFDHGEKLLNFNAGLHQLDTDPDLSNNAIDIIFAVKPRVIPTLNKWSLSILFGLVLIIGFIVLNKNSIRINGLVGFK